MDQILDLGCLEIAVLTNGEPAEDIDRISHELDQAMKFKASLLCQYNSHVHFHECGETARAANNKAHQAFCSKPLF